METDNKGAVSCLGLTFLFSPHKYRGQLNPMIKGGRGRSWRGIHAFYLSSPGTHYTCNGYTLCDVDTLSGAGHGDINSTEWD